MATHSKFSMPACKKTPRMSVKSSSVSEKLGAPDSPVFQLELEDCAVEPAVPSCYSQQQFARLKTRLQYLIGPAEDETEICKDVHACIRTVVQEEGRMDLVLLASRLSSFGYIPVLRTAPGGGHGVDCFNNLHHSFICLHTEAETDGRHIFVDPNFKEQFILQPRVQWYDSLLDVVPEVFVGHQTKIKEIVHLLTKAMAQAFSEQGCGTPPWRRSAALLSKWLPKMGIDQKVELSTGVSGAPGVSSLSAALKEQLIDGHRSCQACGQPRKVHNVKPLTSSGEIPLPCSQDANAGLRPSLLHQFSL